MNKKSLRRAIWLILTSNYSNRAIAERSGFNKDTISKYRVTASSELHTVDHLNALNDDQLDKLFRKTRMASKDRRIPDWSYVHKQLQIKGVTLLLLWEEYVRVEPQTAYSYSQFTHYFRKYLKTVDVTMRQTHLAGEELFIDFAGKTIPYYDELHKVVRQAQVFVAVMGCSNYTFVCACESQKLPYFIEAHNKMFEFLGGVPQALIPDNLKSAVTKPGAIPEINRTYEDLGFHYGCYIFPARVRKPQDKSKAELGVLLATRWITARLRNRHFFSLDEINEAIKPLLDDLNRRPFKKLPGCRQERFEELDLPLLRPLPSRPFEFGEWIGKFKVGPDYHILVNGHAYSVPYKYVGKHVEVRVNANSAEFFYSGKRIAIHPISDVQGAHTTIDNHRPVQHQAYASRQLSHFLEWSKSIGPSSTAIVLALYEDHPDYSVTASKACDQLQKLCRIHGAERFESACSYVRKLPSISLKNVRLILRTQADKANLISPTEVAMPFHNNIRGSEYFSGDSL